MTTINKKGERRAIYFAAGLVIIGYIIYSGIDDYFHPKAAPSSFDLSAPRTYESLISRPQVLEEKIKYTIRFKHRCDSLLSGKTRSSKEGGVLVVVCDDHNQYLITVSPDGIWTAEFVQKLD
ncbi:hypothetical protein IVB27_25390 [Bradyrhizobium sp. 197]|uniref:hypothetical protein n=1 Tax=Bradyrhizobium sp. 197 TaxID=2782663 RepID=UPI001FFBF238|nr:hypothetical protein [Bradyrhizobium sp. 197]MCK1478045.1 hypothetical protein [Bradyrhizobium sp. 197]